MPLIAISACRKIEDYKQSILHVGGEVRLVDASMGVDEALAGVDGLLLTGGDDVAPARYGESAHPAVVEAEAGRDDFEIGLIAGARARDLPIFAICRGIQVLERRRRRHARAGHPVARPRRAATACPRRRTSRTSWRTKSGSTRTRC